MNKIGPIKLFVPLRHRKGRLREKPYLSLLSGLELLEYLQDQIGFDWTKTSVLDFGCGVKWTQALLQFDIPLAKYVGIDIDEKMIHFLKTNVQNEIESLNFII